MAPDDRIGLPASIEELIDREVDAASEELQRRYSRSLAGNPIGRSVMAKVVRRAAVSGLLAQVDLEGRFLGRLPEAGPATWDAWQGMKEQTLEGSQWPERLAATTPEVIKQAGAMVAAAGVESGLRERRTGELRRIGEQAAEAGAALVRCLPASGAPVPKRSGG